MPLAAGTIVLLGAGASMEAGVPMSVGMTTKLVERIGAHAQNHYLASALHFVCGAMLAYDAAEGKNPLAGPPDVERVFAAIRLLEERRKLEVSPFVASWHPAVDAWDTSPRQSSPPFFDQNLQRALLDQPLLGHAERVISQLVDSRMGGQEDGQTYTQLAALMLVELQAAVATTPKAVDYLRPLVAEGRAPRKLTIATLNYDLSVEQAAQAEGVSIETGIEQWVGTGRWIWPQDGIRLLKLHGSIDWFFATEKRAGHLPRDVVQVTDDPGETARPALLFGQRGKLRAEGPFLGLLAEFERELAAAHQLVVIGYSFRDAHVNDVIRRWTGEDFSRKLLVVDPSWPASFKRERRDSRTLEFRAELHDHLTGDSERGLSPRLASWRVDCSEAVRRLRAGPEDQIERELRAAFDERPRVLAVSGNPGLSGVDLELSRPVEKCPGCAG